MNLALQKKEDLFYSEKDELIDLLLKEDGFDFENESIIPLRDKNINPPLSFAQERLWFLEQLIPDSPIYNEPISFRLKNHFEISVYKKAFKEIVSRHEALRTRFEVHDRQPVQIIEQDIPHILSVIDLQNLQTTEKETEAERISVEESILPFDLKKDLMLRAKLLVMDESDYMCLLTLHHITSDGWSINILMKELMELLYAFSNGESSRLPELPIQYADFAVWQRQWLSGELHEKQLSYWKKQLSGLEPINMPTDKKRPAVLGHKGDTLPIVIEPDIINNLKMISQGQGASLYMVLLAALSVILSRYGGQKDIAIGSPIANRNRVELEGLIGFFANTLVLRTDVSDNPTFFDLIARVKKTALDAYANQDLPFEHLVDELQPERDITRNPLVQIVFTFQDVSSRALEISDLATSTMGLKSKIAKFDIDIYLYEENGGLAGGFIYNTDLFESGTIARMIKHYTNLLSAIINDPYQRISDISMISEEENKEILINWNDTAVEYHEKECIHEIFEEQVNRTPNAVAVVFEDTYMTYNELNNRADQLAGYLQEIGIKSDIPVGICFDRSLEMVISMLGVLKSGGAYVPLDPNYPKERLGFMLEDSQITLLITQREYASLFEDKQYKENKTQNISIVVLDENWDEIAGLKKRPLNIATSDNLAYIIYTSGSSGIPKGVMISHKAICNHMLWMQSAFNYDSTDVFLQKTPFSFDASIWEFYAPFLVGGRLILAKPEGHKDISYIIKEVTEKEVTVFQAVPSLFEMISTENGFYNCSTLRHVFCGGEKLTHDLKNRILSQVKADVHNLYGPTEAAIDSTFFTVEEVGSSKSVSIGRPISNAQVYIQDKYYQISPIGTPGELYISGTGLARGYLHRPGLTAEKFIPNIQSEKPGDRVYMSGDLARYLNNGNLEFIGRVDNQVKIKGYRIELGEIESVLTDHPDVREGVVIAHESDTGDKRLLAYVVPVDEYSYDASEIRDYLNTRLPDYMIPSAFIELDTLPLTPNGKVDRRNLPDPDKSGLEEEYVAPRNEIEEKLVEIWSKVLNRDMIGVHDNFFNIGGNSLLATQVVSCLLEEFPVDLTVRVMFECQNIEELSQKIKEARMEEGVVSPIEPISRDEDLPLSFAQERLWFLDQLVPDNPLYNVPIALRMKLDISVSSIKKAFKEIISRHEVIRTRFVVKEGQPIQIIDDNIPTIPFVIDLQGLTGPDKEPESERIASKEALIPFNLEKDLMLRANIVVMDDSDYVLLATMHHIASDGWSMGILQKEFAELFTTFSKGEPSSLPELPIQYADFAAWQRQRLSGEVLDNQLSYWKGQLSGVTPLEIPTDYKRPAVQSFRGDSLPVIISPEVTDRLKSMSRENDVSLYMVLLAAFDIFLSRYSGQDDIVVASPIANRNRKEIEGLIGFFVNTLVMRSDLSGDPTFIELLERVKKIALDAYANQDAPFEHLVDELQPVRDMSRNPLAQIVFSLQKTLNIDFEAPETSVSSFGQNVKTARFDIEVILSDTSEGLTGEFTYNTDLYEASTIHSMIEHFRYLLQTIVEMSDQRISEIPILSEDETEKILVEWNLTDSEYPNDISIQQVFEEQVEKTPESIAVVFEEERLTYSELNKRSNQFARYLSRLGVGPDVTVGICIEKSLKMIVGLLGILKAGGAYVPLDPDYPEERLGFMVSDAGIDVLLTQDKFSAKFASIFDQKTDIHNPSLVSLDKDWEKIISTESTNLFNRTAVDNLAYVTYTSGSTGKPKGVSVVHRGVVRLVKGANYVELNEKDVFLQASTISFDASTFEIWGALLNGATLVVMPLNRPSLKELGFIIKMHQVSTLWLTASLFHLMVADRIEDLANVRQLLAGGDALSASYVKRFKQKHKECQIINGYGPTENTTFTCCCPVTEETRIEGSVPIGRPISNTVTYILDRYLELVPVGVIGEMYAGGDGLSRGYQNWPGLTAEKFIPDPYSEYPGGRLYKIGDLCRYFEDGNIDFIGRIDHQVKIRGFRIELGEIEALLSAHPSVRESVVLVREDIPGDKRLVAYIIPTQKELSDVSIIKEYLAEKLPNYMIPSAFVMMDVMPITPNGKIDRKSLPNPERSGLEKEYVPPGNETEEKLVGIWEEVLGLERIGVHDNFFDIGGNSLLATQVISRISKDFNIEVKVRSMFEYPEIKIMAMFIETITKISHDQEPSEHVIAESREVGIL